MGKPSREKGARGEREVCDLFRAAGLDCWRTPNSGGLRVKGDLQGLAGLHVEAKRCEHLDVSGWLRQARSEAPSGSVPVVCFRRSREEWQAVLPLSSLVELLA